jgi:thiol-disulfide isomerase/thioredoxin
MADLTVVLLDEGDAVTVSGRLDGGEASLGAEALLAATGWELKPQGLCKGAVCIPYGGELVTLSDLARLLGRPLAIEMLADRAVAVLGQPAGAVAASGEVAEPLTLPDVNGNPVAITGSGRKTAVVAWSTWCGCRYELPAWKALAEELREDGLDVVTVALDEDAEAVRPWAETTDLPTGVDLEHRLSDLFGVVNVPATIWLDEEGRVVKPPTIAPGDDQFVEFTELESARHHDALRAWVRGGDVPAIPEVVDDEDLRAARAERRLAAWLHRHGETEAAERHFAEAVSKAPLDFSIVRSSMPLRGQDPFGTEFFELWESWNAAGRPGYVAT